MCYTYDDNRKVECGYMYCTNCGNLNNNSDKFCKKCGTSLNNNLQNQVNQNISVISNQSNVVVSDVNQRGNNKR